MDIDNKVTKNAQPYMGPFPKGAEVVKTKGAYTLIYIPAVQGYWIYFPNGKGEGLGALSRQAALIEFNRLVSTATNSAVANGINPAIKKEYDDYVKSKAKFDKWWNTDRSIASKSKIVQTLNDARRKLIQKYREVYGTYLPNGWGEPGRLEVACSAPTPNSAVANSAYVDVMKESKKMASAAWKLTMDTPPAEAKAKWPNMYRYMVKNPEYAKRWAAEIKAVGNAAACNASSFEFGVGDKVGVGGKTGFVKAKYFKDGKICIDVDIGSKVVTVEPKDIVKNAAACNGPKLLFGGSEFIDDSGSLTKADLIAMKKDYIAHNDPRTHKAGLLESLGMAKTTDHEKQMREYNDTLKKFDMWIAKAKNAVVSNALAWKRGVARNAATGFLDAHEESKVVKNDQPTFGELKEMKRKYMALMKQGEQAKRTVELLNSNVQLYAREAKALLEKVKKWVADDYMDDDDLYSAKDFAAEADRLVTAMKYAYPAIRDNF